ncbi:MAG: DUF4338 domain-containing protein [bacterium]|nr:DUF4338 domain-containing protein [bacterium]
MSRTYCGRPFHAAEIEAVRAWIAEHPEFNRAQLSRLVCERLKWRRPDGRLKEMSCRVALLRMQADGWITLPPPRGTNGNGQSYARRTPAADPELFGVFDPVGALLDLRLELVAHRRCSHLWNEYIDRYHYLGYQPLPGAQLRYFAYAQDRPLALLGFGAAAWKTRVRDDFIGWTARQREARLHRLVNNARFLILPWVHSRNLASRLLAMAAARLAQDWQEHYGYRPVLIETFVEVPRFHGTCYQAANWTCLGETRGRGKRDVNHQALLPKKSVWVYPLIKDFRATLCAPDP